MLSCWPLAAILACTFAFVFSASAGAALVSISPGGNVTGTAGTTSWTFNTARRTLDCTMSDFRATLERGNGGSWALGITTNMQLRFAGCRIVGGLNTTIACGSAGVWAVTGRTSTYITPGIGYGTACTVSVNATCTVRITGSFSINYSNLTGDAEIVSPSGQSLAATGSTCSILPNDSSMTFGIYSGGSIFYIVSPYQSMTAS